MKCIRFWERLYLVSLLPFAKPPWNKRSQNHLLLLVLDLVTLNCHVRIQYNTLQSEWNFSRPLASCLRCLSRFRPVQTLICVCDYPINPKSFIKLVVYIQLQKKVSYKKGGHVYRDTLGEAAWVRHQISRLVGCAKGNKSPKGGLAHLASRLVLAVSLTIIRGKSQKCRQGVKKWWVHALLTTYVHSRFFAFPPFFAKEYSTKRAK